MSAQTSPPGKSGSTNANQPAYPATKKKSTALLEEPLTSHSLADEYEQRQAETFYLQKQVQLQTPMMIVLVRPQHTQDPRPCAQHDLQGSYQVHVQGGGEVGA